MGEISVSQLAGDSLQKIVFMQKDDYANDMFLLDSVVNFTGADWNTDKAFLTHIHVTTSSTSWSIVLHSDSTGGAGLLGTGLNVAQGMSGSRIISLGNLPYIDNNGTKAVHVWVSDEDWAADMVITFYGIKAR